MTDRELMLMYWNVTTELMDPEIRETLAREGYDTIEDFLDEYLARHKSKYGVEFAI